MKCHANVNSTPPTQLPHKFSYIVAILIHNQIIVIHLTFILRVKKNCVEGTFIMFVY
jgi:hypothetical protein